MADRNLYDLGRIDLIKMVEELRKENECLRSGTSSVTAAASASSSAAAKFHYIDCPAYFEPPGSCACSLLSRT